MHSTKKNELENFIPVEVQQAEVSFSPNDLEFWSNNPREEVIVATGSIRKAIMLVAQMQNFSFKVHEGGQSNGKLIEINDPLALQEYFSDYIYNGNGSLKDKTFMGYLYGVPIYAEPSFGESNKNDDPYQEAVNKVWELYQRKYQDRNVLILSTDTVDRPNIAKEPLGKPENDPYFPKRDDYIVDGIFWEFSYTQSVIGYLEDFKEMFYTTSSYMIHTNAVAILDAFSGMFIDLEEKLLLELNIMIDKDKLKMAYAQADMGGGGMTQQLIDWYETEIVDSYFSGLVAEVFKDEDDPVTLRMALYCQIAGMPYAIIELLNLANAELQAIKKVEEDIKFLDGDGSYSDEMVIFDASSGKKDSSITLIA